MGRMIQGAAALAAALLGMPQAGFSAEPVEWLFDQVSEVVGSANLESACVTNGALAGATAWDPHFSLRCPKDGLDAAQLTWLTVRMFSSADADLLDVYYGSPDGLWCLGGKQPVRKGWATYRLDLSKNSWRETTAGEAAKRWGGASGRVSALRLDPGNQAGRWVAIDRVRLEPAQPGLVEGVVAEPRGRASLRALRAPKAVEEGGRLEVSATFDVTVPEGLTNGTAFLRLRHGEALMQMIEAPVTFAGQALNVAAEFPVSRYWNSGALTVEAGCYELDGASATARVALANSRIGRVKPPASDAPSGWRSSSSTSTRTPGCPTASTCAATWRARRWPPDPRGRRGSRGPRAWPPGPPVRWR